MFENEEDIINENNKFEVLFQKNIFKTIRNNPIKAVCSQDLKNVNPTCNDQFFS